MIKTVHGRGYRCVALVEEYSPAAPGDTLLTAPTHAHVAAASPAVVHPVDAERKEGTIQHFVDNGFLAYFGASVTQEDHAQRAVLAALHIREQCRITRAELTPLPGREQAVCMAVHTGEVIVGTIGTDPRRIALAVDDTTQIV